MSVVIRIAVILFIFGFAVIRRVDEKLTSTRNIY